MNAIDEAVSDGGSRAHRGSLDVSELGIPTVVGRFFILETRYTESAVACETVICRQQLSSYLPRNLPPTFTLIVWAIWAVQSGRRRCVTRGRFPLERDVFALFQFGVGNLLWDFSELQHHL